MSGLVDRPVGEISPTIPHMELTVSSKQLLWVVTSDQS